MRIIISESQLRLIIENEDNLMDLSPVKKYYHPSQWDEMFEMVNNKKGGKYDGYYINGDLDLRNLGLMNRHIDDSNYDYDYDDDFESESDIPFGLKYLVRVNGFLNLRYSEVTDLSNLKYVESYLNISGTNIDKLPELEHVGGGFALENTKVNDLPKLKYVRGILSTNGTPLSGDVDKLKKIFDKLGKRMR